MLLGIRRILVAVLAVLLGLGGLALVAPSANATTPTPVGTAPDHLVIAAVYGGAGGTGTYDWIELYNPTASPVSLGTISGPTVSPNFTLCYRGYSTSPQACSTNVGLWGTVEAHHYFFVATSGSAGAPAGGVTPDLDATAAAKNAGGQAGTNMGGSTTGGQVLLLNPNASGASGAATLTGDLSSATAQADGVVDAVGWTHYASSTYTQPNAAETHGATGAVTGATGGTANTNVIARTFTNGIPQDTDFNSSDFTAIAASSFTMHSQISDHVAVAAVSNATISVGEAMTPIQVMGSKGTGALSYSASGLPAGISINASTGVISGTPDANDTLQSYPVTVTVADSTPGTPDTTTTSFNLTVSNDLRVDSIANSSIHKGAAITPIQVNAHGGTPGYTYTATGLPAGLQIDQNSGAITGTPADAVGTYSVHVTVTDSSVGTPQDVSTTFTLTDLPATTGPGNSDALADLQINEVEATGTPANDWVELINTGSADITGASVDLTDSSGASDKLTGLHVPAGGFTVINGSDLHTAGLDLSASDTLYLSETGDNILLDQTSWTSYATTSWARYPDGTGAFVVSKQATKGAANSLPATAATDNLEVAAVYGADGTTFNSDWVELYNPTDQPINLGTIDSSGVVTPNYYQCYRSNSSNTCSSMKLYGTVQPHHYFLIWNGHNADATVDAHSKGLPPTGITPDLDFRYGSDDTNSSATKAANDPSGQTNNGFGGCNTGGQLWLLNASSGGTAPGGDMSSSAAHNAGVVDGVGWTASGVTQPTGAESKGLSTVTGFNSGTNNACVIARKFAFGYPVDTDVNSTDFTAIQDPSTYNLQSQTSERVAVSPVSDTEISLNEQMPPIQVKATAIFGALTYQATGLPDGITIDSNTGVISGTPTPTDTLQPYPVTVTVGDAVPSDTATISFTLTLSAGLRVNPVANTAAPKGEAITPIQIVGHGGTHPYTFSVTGLPSGLTIDPISGEISGTPTGAVGSYSVHVTVTDSGTGTDQQSVSTGFTFVEQPETAAPSPGDPLAGLKINEVRATGTAANDWVELYNTGDAITGASVELVNSAGETYAVPTQNIAAGGYVVINGSDLHAAGLDLAASDTLYLTEAGDGPLLDSTSWTTYEPTSWARTTDGTGSFTVSGWATKGAANSGAPSISPNDLLVTEVNYDNNSTDYYEYSEVTNTTSHPIDFSAYGLSITKSGALMTLHDPSDTSGASPIVDPVIPAHGTQLFWWDENQYLGVKTTAQFRANYGLPSSTPVILVQGFTSMANSGGDHSFYISVNQASTLISQAWVDTPCAANTFNGTAVCTATNGNYAEHYEVPSDRTNPTATVWYDSLAVGGDDINHALKAALSTPGTVDLEQLGFTRAAAITSVTSGAITLHNTSSAAVDLSGYVLQKNAAGATYTLPPGTTVGAGDDLVINGSTSGLTFSGGDYVSLLAPRGYAYTDGVGIADTTGPFLHTMSYDASSGQSPVIDPTTGLPLPPAGGLYRPAGVSAANGTVYASNTGDNVLAALANGSNTIVAGSLEGYGDTGDEGLATHAYLYQPGGTAEDANGDIFVADSGDNVIREITKSDGKIHLFAGTGATGGQGEAVTGTSTPTTVNLWHPESVAVDGSGNVFIADTFDNRVLEVNAADTTISVVAGTGTARYGGDGGLATSATLSHPAGVALDAEGDVYIADSSNNVIRRVDATTGVITTVAGDFAADQASNSCLGGFTGDGGPATSAELNDPQSVVLDGAGDLFIADTFNNAVREVTPDGTITTLVNASGVAGSENTSPTGSGAIPASTRLNTPYSVGLDQSTGVLYIADTHNNAIAAVSGAGQAGAAPGPVESADALALSSSTTAATACAVLQNGPVASTSAPHVSGTPAQGSTLTADTGTWTPTPDSFAYQWLRDGVPIPGATGATYVVTAADGGHVLSVSVTAVKADFASASATTVAVSVPLLNITAGTPTIGGTPLVGSTLTANAGTWTPTPDSFTYEWLRDGAVIAGATGATYTTTSADAGHSVSVSVVGSKLGYNPAGATSATVTISEPVVAPKVLTAPTPAISGTFKVGDRLTAKPSTWKAGSTSLPASDLTYLWLRNGKKITGATKSTYVLVASDKGTKISLTVTGNYAGYETASRTSASHTIAAGTLAAATPAISGAAKVGKTLTARAGTWKAGAVKLTGTHLKYQWYANGKRIAGATKATYKIGSSYNRKKITVTVTGSYTGYTSVSKTSKATRAVTK